MLCGSCAGVVTWAAWMQAVVNEFESVRDTSSYSQSLFFFSVSQSWRAVYAVTYAIEFLFLSVAKLMVLDRMSDFAAGLWIWKHWNAGRRVVVAVVVAGNLVGLGSNIAAAVPYTRVAQLNMEASAAYSSNNFVVGQQKLDESRHYIDLANSITSVQAFCEVAVLLLIVVAFAVVGAVCVRRISSRVTELDSASIQLRRQIIGTTAVVFVTFLVRSAFSAMSAAANQMQEMSKACKGVTSFCDESCFNFYTHIYTWMQYTPEFQVSIVLISKPLPLLVSLWGMTSPRMRVRLQTTAADIKMRDSMLAKMRDGMVRTLTIWRQDHPIE
jgi:hypothetical protein